MEYHLKKLEEKVDKHNNIIEEQYNTENEIDLLKEKQKVTSHRPDDLERKR